MASPPPPSFHLYLAPMVRASTIPLRLLALSLGATATYSEEIIDRSIGHTERVVNDTLGTIDFVKRKQASKKQKKAGVNPDVVVFRTHRDTERNKLIFQLGTADPVNAAAAAKHLSRDVDGIDVNMGCPKKFSVTGGMGSALLKDPARAASIITAIKAATTLPGESKLSWGDRPARSAL